MSRFNPVELYPDCPETFTVTEQVSVTAQALARSAMAHEHLKEEMWANCDPEVREYHMNCRLEALRADAEIFVLLGHDESTFPRYPHKQGA